MKHRRVLLVNTIQVGESNGTGNTLKNLFQLYPQDKQMQLVVYPDTGQQVFSDIETWFTPLSVCEFPYRLHLRRLKKRTAKTLQTGQADFKPGVSIPKSDLRSKLHEMINGLLDMWPIRYKAIYEKIDTYKPEIIYTCAGSIRIMKIVEKIAKRYDIPVVVHMMDDWPSTIYSSSVLSAVSRRKTLKMLERIYRLSNTDFAISDALAEKYKMRFSKEHITLMNPTVISTARKNSGNRSSSIKFLYAGSLSLKRDESLLVIAKVLKRLKEDGFCNSFDIYTSENQNTASARQAFAPYGVKVFNYVSSDKVYDLYREYDALVFTESFAEECIAFTSLSLSTKVPEYLASGVAMLAYLPKKLHSAQYLSAKKIAAVANSEEELEGCCKRLINDEVYRQRLLTAAHSVAKNEFSETSVKVKLEKVFSDA
ncbi:MAG: hypothetical protein RRY72_08050 [Bacteroides sp.]